MKTHYTLCYSLCLCLLTIFCTVQPQPTAQDEDETKSEAVQKQEAKKPELAFEPVDNMHHFMEYVCEPSYKSLKKWFAEEGEKDRAAWKVFKNHALVLAESSALVAQRAPEKNSEEWKQIAHDVYTSGSAMYKSKGDFAKAKKHYGTVIENCNQCHKKFADGKYQLKK